MTKVLRITVLKKVICKVKGLKALASATISYLINVKGRQEVAGGR